MGIRMKGRGIMTKAYDIETKLDGYRYKQSKEKIHLEEKKYCDQNAVKDVIYYVVNEHKTRAYFGGNHCSDDQDEAVEDFLNTKEDFNQCEGQQLKHLLIDFDRKINRKTAEEYAVKIAKYAFDNYQSFYGVHYNNKRTHIHFAVNTVSYIDGNCLINTNDILYKMKEYILANHV
jgi:Relaxase/Mobilisation nuclease domain.